jgi:hypothetical protein
MVLSSFQSVAFTFATISPTGFFSVTLTESKGNGLKEKNVENEIYQLIYTHFCQIMVTCKEIFGFMMPLPLVKNLSITNFKC